MSIADYARSLTASQLIREIACARSNGGDAEYVLELERILADKVALATRPTEPPPAPEQRS